jgi:hypothetical protein
MQSSCAVKITYWAEQIGEHQLRDLVGIDEFRKELAEAYPAVVHGRPSDLGGGLLHLAIEFVSSFSLGDVASFLASGVAYDLIKDGTRALVLRPFLQAYEKLKKQNDDLDVDSLRLVMNDSVIVVYRLGKDSVLENIQRILKTIASEYHHLVRRSGEAPYEIHVPVFEDPARNPPARFRVLLDVDETIKPKPSSDYLRYWGLVYDFSRGSGADSRVYDVSSHFVLDEEFLSQRMYEYRTSRSFDTVFFDDEA